MAPIFLLCPSLSGLGQAAPWEVSPFPLDWQWLHNSLNHAWQSCHLPFVVQARLSEFLLQTSHTVR